MHGLHRIGPALLVLVGALGGGVAAAAAAGPAPAFVADGDAVAAPEGHATLRWQFASGAAAAGTIYQLEQSRDAGFAEALVRYVGPDDALFVSGLLDGSTWFRVRAVPPGREPSPWSRPLAVEVAYPSRRHVLWLLATGCVVFLGTVVAIVTGWRREAGRDEP